MLATMDMSAGHWHERLDALVRANGVPGAALAIWHRGQLVETATGLLNAEIGVEATPDSLFQIGSVTKPFTATLVMQLVAEGAIDLDQPLVDVLPGLRFQDSEATAKVTMRHVLNHTSGIDGDYFADFGRGDDTLSKYVESCADIGFSHPVGATMSYSNTAYIVAGRVVEVLTGMTWDQALRERLTGPLGLEHTLTLPEDMLRFRVAHGHIHGPGEPPRLARTWGLSRSMGPAGFISSTAADLVTFARMHLAGGRSTAGDEVLAASQVRAMQRAEVALPDPWTFGSHWGLGWILYDWDGTRVVGHDGGTIGQTAYLRMVPEADVVVALLTNGGPAQELYQALFAELMSQLCDVNVPSPLEPPPSPPAVSFDGLAGVYERAGARIEVTDSGQTLSGRFSDTSALAELKREQTVEMKLHPVSDGLFVACRPGERTGAPVVFYELSDGSRYLHTGGRATPRAGD